MQYCFPFPSPYLPCWCFGLWWLPETPILLQTGKAFSKSFFLSLGPSQETWNNKKPAQSSVMIVCKPNKNGYPGLWNGEHGSSSSARKVLRLQYPLQRQEADGQWAQPGHQDPMDVGGPASSGSQLSASEKPGTVVMEMEGTQPPVHVGRG